MVAPNTTSGSVTCLNCGAELHGPFCGGCGQRVVPPYPTLREMAGDAWKELSGYDGRFARTLRLLLRRPGVLTVEVLEGRRARYVSPVRLYLAASLLFFVIGAAVPSMRAPQPVKIPGSDVTIDMMSTDGSAFSALSAEDQAEALARIDRAPWGLRPLFRSALLNPLELRSRFLATLPRVLFFLVPVFACIVALFYRRRMSQHLIFALHLHTTIFLVFGVQRLLHLIGRQVVVQVTAIAAFVFLASYALLAFRRVYGGAWPVVVAKSLGIVVIYAAVGAAALVATFAWAAMT
jgi:hypothetical protein